MAEDLGVSVNDNIRTKEGFGKIQEALKKAGIAGTLQVIKEEDAHSIIDAAWKLSQGTKKIVVVVLRER